MDTFWRWLTTNQLKSEGGLPRGKASKFLAATVAPIALQTAPEATILQEKHAQPLPQRIKQAWQV
jgi:hypothetical protein